MSYSKKHFELTARLIKAQRQQSCEIGSTSANQRLDALADDFADAVEWESDRFDRERFLKACGVTT